MNRRRIDNGLDLKWANETGGQLPGRNVLHILTDLVARSRNAAAIRQTLILVRRMEKIGPGLFPHPPTVTDYPARS